MGMMLLTLFLEQLSRELYTVTQDSCGNWQYFDESWDGIFRL